MPGVAAITIAMTVEDSRREEFLDALAWYQAQDMTLGG